MAMLSVHLLTAGCCAWFSSEGIMTHTSNVMDYRKENGNHPTSQESKQPIHFWVKSTQTGVSVMSHKADHVKWGTNQWSGVDSYEPQLQESQRPTHRTCFKKWTLPSWMLGLSVCGAYKTGRCKNPTRYLHFFHMYWVPQREGNLLMRMYCSTAEYTNYWAAHSSAFKLPSCFWVCTTAQLLVRDWLLVLLRSWNPRPRSPPPAMSWLSGYRIHAWCGLLGGKETKETPKETPKETLSGSITAY